jgi:hypothetical protein
VLPASADAFRAYRFKVSASGTFESSGTVPGECVETANQNYWHSGTATSSIRFSTVTPWRMESVKGGSLEVPGDFPRLINTTNSGMVLRVSETRASTIQFCTTDPPEPPPNQCGTRTARGGLGGNPVPIGRRRTLFETDFVASAEWYDIDYPGDGDVCPLADAQQFFTLPRHEGSVGVFGGGLTPIVRTARITGRRRFVVRKSLHGVGVGSDGSTATYRLVYRLKFVRLPLIPR